MTLELEFHSLSRLTLNHEYTLHVVVRYDHWTVKNTYCTYAQKKKVRKLNFVIVRLAILMMGVSTELWRFRFGCFTIPRSNFEL